MKQVKAESRAVREPVFQAVCKAVDDAVSGAVPSGEAVPSGGAVYWAVDDAVREGITK
jgi:hypothetical protein